MHFKSGNWELLRKMIADNEFPVRVKVSYTHADLPLPVSGKTIKDADTTIVVILDEDHRYVGFCQKGPNCEYKQEKGREIAAGRALRALDRGMFENAKPDHDFVWNDGRRYKVFGRIPEHLREAVEKIL